MPWSRSSEAASWRMRVFTGTLSASMRLRADRAGLGQAMADLEALHGFGQHHVVGIAVGDFGRQVVGDGEALAQRRDVRAAHAGLERALGSVGQPPRTSIAE